MLVHFFLTHDDVERGVRVPISGRLEFLALAPRTIVGTPDEVVLPAVDPVTLDADGKATVLLPGGHWRVMLRGSVSWPLPVYVTVPAGVACDWPDLVRVDPATLDPAASPEPAWWAALDGISGDIGGAVADYLGENPPTVGGLDSLTDVDTTGQADGDVLQLVAGVWTPQAPPVRPAGPAGADGDPGADGASAYEIAVAAGFVGSESAWLASLVGDPGPAGADGIDGDPGPAGADGIDGATGPAGADGTAGTRLVSSTVTIVSASRSWPGIIRPPDWTRGRIVVRNIGINPITLQTRASRTVNYNAPSWAGAVIISVGQEWIGDGTAAQVHIAPSANDIEIRALVFCEVAL